MDLNFTWATALKLFAGVLLAGVWLLARGQAKLDRRVAQERSAAESAGRALPPRRLVPRSQRIIVFAALLLVALMLFLGNIPTL